MNGLLNEFSALKRYENILVEDIKELLKNKDIPLDERWEAYLKVEESLPGGGWITRYKNLEGYDYFDDFYFERHMDILHSDIIDRIEDDPESFEDVDLAALKEEFLQTGKQGFNLDW